MHLQEHVAPTLRCLEKLHHHKRQLYSTHRKYVFDGWRTEKQWKAMKNNEKQCTIHNIFPKYTKYIYVCKLDLLLSTCPATIPKLRWHLGCPQVKFNRCENGEWMVNGGWGSCETPLMDGKNMWKPGQRQFGSRELGNVTARAKVLTPSRQAKPSTRCLPRFPDKWVSLFIHMVTGC